MKVFYGGKNVVYKAGIVLTVIFALFFGQAAVNCFGKYISKEFLNILISFAVPSLDTSGRYAKISESFGISPKEIVANEKVSADTAVKETAASAVNADYATAKGIEVKNNTDYFVDIESLINEPLGFTINKAKPSVLIVHTHSSEAYMKTDGENYEQTENKRTQNQQYNVIKVGEEFKKALENRGITAIHNKTVHDYPSYNGSYLNALKTITAELEKNPSIKMVIDIHRDAVEADGTVYKFSSEIDGKKVAQVMLISGSDANGIENPNWKENFKFALKFQRRMNLLYPGLTRPLSLVRERYNTHLTTGSVILEIGTTGNTLDEAVAAARLSGDALGDMLNYIAE